MKTNNNPKTTKSTAAASANAAQTPLQPQTPPLNNALPFELD